MLIFFTRKSFRIDKRMERQKNEMYLKECKDNFDNIVEEIEMSERERDEIEKRMVEIEARCRNLQEAIEILTHKKECLSVLLDEIDIGYDKILASSQCLSILASRKLRKLKRKYLKYLKF